MIASCAGAAAVTSDEGKVGLVTFWGNDPCERGCEMDVRRGGSGQVDGWSAQGFLLICVDNHTGSVVLLLTQGKSGHC